MTYRIVRGVRDLGQVNGMQVPVFGRNGLEGAVSFAGERLDLNAGCKLAAQAFCPILFFALKRLRGPVSAGDAQALSEREREVLQWIALGKQQAEVAAILMISERTVENHLRAARRRLGAASTPRRWRGRCAWAISRSERPQGADVRTILPMCWPESISSWAWRAVPGGRCGTPAAGQCRRARAARPGAPVRR